MDETLTAADLEQLRKDFSANAAYRLAQNAVTRVTVDDVAINREIVASIDHSLSTTLDDWKVTNQERSGRCWLFAGLNLLRVGVMRKTGLKDFEFSQNYTMFWDKLERANYLLEAIIETADRDLDDRTVAFLLKSAASDGGPVRQTATRGGRIDVPLKGAAYWSISQTSHMSGFAVAIHSLPEAPVISGLEVSSLVCPPLARLAPSSR